MLSACGPTRFCSRHLQNACGLGRIDQKGIDRGIYSTSGQDPAAHVVTLMCYGSGPGRPSGSLPAPIGYQRLNKPQATSPSASPAAAAANELDDQRSSTALIVAFDDRNVVFGFKRPQLGTNSVQGELVMTATPLR
jgi:hypothetical protein